MTSGPAISGLPGPPAPSCTSAPARTARARVAEPPASMPTTTASATPSVTPSGAIDPDPLAPIPDGKRPDQPLASLPEPAHEARQPGKTQHHPEQQPGASVTDIVLFHHAQGLTDGVRQFAGQLRAAGHQVITPDLYEG